MLEIFKTDHSVHSIGSHIVWCTKFRHPILVDSVEVLVKKTIGETCSEYGWKCRTVEIMPDHVHLFVQISPTDSLSCVARTLKSITAIAIFCSFPMLKGNKFWGSGLWSRGTYYGSVGNCSQEIIVKYIESQKQK